MKLQKRVIFERQIIDPYSQVTYKIDYGYNSPVVEYFDVKQLMDKIRQHLNDGYEVLIREYYFKNSV
jgi:hypothetical protein